MHKLTIYDASGKNVLGKVTQKKCRNKKRPLARFFEKEFILEMNGTELGSMTSHVSLGLKKFNFTFNNWSVYGDIFKLNFRLMNKLETIMSVKKKALTIGDTYHVDIYRSENELLCVLILLAIDSSLTSKHIDNKRAFRRRTRKFIPFIR